MYYQCYGKKMVKTDCTKKNMRKEFIERVVAEDALSILTDENIELIASTAVQTNAREMESDTNIPTIRGKLHETEISLSNITKAIESGEVPQTLVKRMLELEKEKKSLEKDLRREEKKITLLDKELVVHWLEQFKNGDIEDEEFVICGDVTLTQNDIRQYQLAKSAIYSAIITLMKQKNVTFGDIENVYISGGFSAEINIKNAVLTGLLPKELEHLKQLVLVV
jgi:hypothetical protein